MPRITIIFAIVFIILGVGLYVATDRASVTALIPSFLGILMLGCGVLAQKESRRKHAMHVAVLLALLGAGGSARGFAPALKHAGGEAVEHPIAAWGQVGMAILCVLFIVVAVRSFIAARKAREA